MSNEMTEVTWQYSLFPSRNPAQNVPLRNFSFSNLAQFASECLTVLTVCWINSEFPMHKKF